MRKQRHLSFMIPFVEHGALIWILSGFERPLLLSLCQRDFVTFVPMRLLAEGGTTDEMIERAAENFHSGTCNRYFQLCPRCSRREPSMSNRPDGTAQDGQ